MLKARYPIGNALLVNTARLDTSTEGENLSKGDAKKVTNSTTRVAAVVRGKAGTPLERLCPTLVVSVHLDATDEYKRVKQVRMPSVVCAHGPTHQREDALAWCAVGCRGVNCTTRPARSLNPRSLTLFFACVCLPACLCARGG